MRFALDYLKDFKAEDLSIVSLNSTNQQAYISAFVRTYNSASTLSSALKSVSNENVFLVLNEHLANFSYLNGYQLSECDLKIFSYLSAVHGGGNFDCGNQLDAFPHLQRWLKHIRFHHVLDKPTIKVTFLMMMKFVARS